MFDGIYGHDEIKERLESSVLNNTVSHAYIFCGSRGIGKTTVARKFAGELTRESVADTVFVTNEHYGVKGKAALSVDTVRAARVDMFTKPYLSEKKVFIFPDAHTMTAGAQNALLKVLEEPPSYCVIILITENEKVLLPTVRSRAVVLRFLPLPDSVIARYQAEKYGMQDNFAIRLASGSIAALDELVGDDGQLAAAKEFAVIFKRFGASDKSCIYEAAAMFEREKEKCGILFDVMEIMLHDLLFDNNETDDVLKLKGVTKGAALAIIDRLEKTAAAINQSRNYNIAVTELLLDAWRIIHD